MGGMTVRESSACTGLPADTDRSRRLDSPYVCCARAGENEADNAATNVIRSKPGLMILILSSKIRYRDARKVNLKRFELPQCLKRGSTGDESIVGTA